VARAAVEALTAIRLHRSDVPLLVVVAACAIVLTLLLPLDGSIAWWPLPFVALGFIIWSMMEPDADPVLLPIVAALCCIGLLVVARLDADLAGHQAQWMLLGIAIVIVGRPAFARYRRLASVAYPWVAGTLVLFVLLRFFGHEVNGARLWFTVGRFNAQPVEIAKLFMVFFMASYLTENGLSIAATPLSHVRETIRLLGPLVLGWGVSIVTLAFQRDVGMAALFLGIFLVMLYAASKRTDLVLLFALIFAAGTWFVAAHYPYVGARVSGWLDPWSDPLGRGYQPEQGYFSLAAGGLFGTGYHLGQPGFIPDASTDYVFAAWAEEFGAIGGFALLALYLALVTRALRIAFFADDRFTSLLATGFAAILGIQVFVIVGGVVGLVPLTGITLPFISYGGSSMVANILMVGLLRLFSVREVSGSRSAGLGLSTAKSTA
jgi:cell division protein FtsW (lipid II flippase)